MADQPTMTPEAAARWQLLRRIDESAAQLAAVEHTHARHPAADALHDATMALVDHHRKENDGG